MTRREWLTAPMAVLTAALIGIAAAPVLAQTVRTVQDAPLRQERTGDAATLATLAANSAVNLLQLAGGWAQVEVPSSTTSQSSSSSQSRTAPVGTTAQRGWVRASLLDLRPPEVAAASRVETGRRESGATAVTLGSRSLPPRSNRHALIIGIGRYRVDAARPVPALVGIDRDMASALQMARALQVPDDQITLLRDEAATSDGIAAAIREIGARAAPGDRVFVYWSGHGSRYFDAAEGGCVESLVPYDLQDVTQGQLARWLEPVGAQADKLLVVVDACHSGGVTAPAALTNAGPASAALRGAAPGAMADGDAWQAKFVPGVSDACRTPSNLRTRGLIGPAVRGQGLSGQDVVQLSSSRPDEVSLQNAAEGGMATSALRLCLLGDARDTDGSGSVSAQELADCAQAKIDRALAGNARYTSAHIVVSGNREFVPAWFAGSAAGTVAPRAQGPAVESAAASSSSSSVSDAVPLARVLEQIHAQRDSKRGVRVTAAPQRLRIGADALTLRITSSHAGYVYVAMLGSDAQSLVLLFPNAKDDANRIAVGETMTLPRSQWQVTAGGPPGRDQLLVIVADGPRDLPGLGGGKVGPFVQPLTDAQGRSQLQWLMGTRVQAKEAGPRTCTGAECSDAFGSALISVEEF